MSWNVDNSHSSINFTVRHMMFAKVHGSFKKWTTELDGFNPETGAGKIRAEIDVTSVDTGTADRDAHLRSADFFDVERFAAMRFESTGVEPKGEGRYALHGGLTIKDQTLPVTLEVERLGLGTDPWGNARAGFSAKTTINRKDFGLTWNQVLEAGGVLVSEKVEISLELQVVQAA